MDSVIEWLREARGEITAGLVLALLGWLYSKYRAFMKMYRLKKKELERMESEMFKFGNTKKEIERLQEALKESEAQRQDVQSQLEATRQELQSKDEALRETEAQRQGVQGQLEATQQELQRRDEALREAEAKSQEASRRIEAQQQDAKQEEAKKKNPPMSDWEFIALCRSGDAR